MNYLFGNENRPHKKKSLIKILFDVQLQKKFLWKHHSYIEMVQQKCVCANFRFLFDSSVLLGPFISFYVSDKMIVKLYGCAYFVCVCGFFFIMDFISNKKLWANNFHLIYTTHAQKHKQMEHKNNKKTTALHAQITFVLYQKREKLFGTKSEWDESS